MKLECNFCKSKIFKKTDSLWLVTVRNRDYLLCKFHKNKQDLKKRYQNDNNKTQVKETV